ncbi:MAG: TrkH family potassium uptake protein [Oscillospiraceae bacterium]|nr:TrkH family potassium uptake protein [Oscillospiraceae bacterium]
MVITMIKLNKFNKYMSESNVYGKLALLVGVLISFPLFIIPFYPDESRYLNAFLIPSGVAVVLGFVICIFAPRGEGVITEWQSPLQKGSLPVLFIWVFAFISGAFPFFIGGQYNSRIILALFEAVSGWTSTGLTISDVAVMPRIFLLHRAFMQYCGGLGFIIVIAMLARGKQSISLYNAEGHADRIMPSLKRTAQIITLLYSCLLGVGIIAYHAFGMELFDSICHAMSAISTAGFSTKAGSIGEYNSLPIDIITIVLMLIGSINFAALLLLLKGGIRKFFRISEVRLMRGIILVFLPLVSFSLFRDMNMGFGEGIKNALFGITSIFTTSGYSLMNYAEFPPFALGLFFVLMFVGGSAGSTSGGIKLIRVYLFIRIMKENIKKRFSPSRRITSPSYERIQGKTPIDDTLVKDTFGFISCYMMIYVIGVLLLSLTAESTLFDSMFEFASAFGTVGISNGITSADASVGTLVILMCGMILGRLEIFIVFIGVYTCARKLGRKLSPARGKYTKITNKP